MPILRAIRAVFAGAALSNCSIALFLSLVTLLACDSTKSLSGAEGSARSDLRIVSLHDVSSEILVGLGLTQKIVGVEELVDPLPALRTALAVTPRVSSLESIVVLRPTHVVGLMVTQRRDPQLVTRLRELGVSVVLGEPVSLASSVEFIHTLAEQFGLSAQGLALSEPLRAELQRGTSPREKAALGQPVVRVDHSGALSVVRALPAVPSEALPSKRPKVFVYDCCEPPFTAGGNGLLNELLERAGARNIFSELNADWASVSWEAVVAGNPDLVVIHAYDYEGQKDVQSKLASLRKIPGLQTVRTVSLPLGCSLGGLRSVEGLALLSRAVQQSLQQAVQQ